LKAIYPNSELTLLCRKGVGEIFRELNISDVVELDKKNQTEFSKTILTLKKNSYDLLICPHESYRSAFISLKVKAKIKIGFKKWWNFFVFNKSVLRNMKLPEALRQLSLLQWDREAQSAISDYLKNNKIPVVAHMGLKEKILKHQRYSEILKKFNLSEQPIFLSPGSVWNTKRWTMEGFEKVAEKLSPSPIVFIGSSDEKKLCFEISSHVKGSLNLAGETSLFELLCLLTKGRVLVSNDSGAMHMASVAELPTVAVFGPTVLELGYQPWQNRAVVVENKELKCRPCGKHGHQKCPIGTHECMKSISSEKVLENINKLQQI
jgi:heptosyltransferase-2